MPKKKPRKTIKVKGHYDLPEEATKENIEELIKKGKEIAESKPKWTQGRKGEFFIGLIGGAFFGLVLLPVFFLLFFVVFGLFSMVYVFFTPYVKTYPIPFLALFLGLFAGVLIGSAFISFFLSDKIFKWYLYRKLKFPPPEHEVFSVTTILTEQILDDKRKTAPLLYSLDCALARYFFVNQDMREVLSEKTKIFGKSRTLRRMILLSGNPKIPYLFLNFGLSLVHGKFPRLTSIIDDLGKQVERFDKKGRFERLMVTCEKYGKSLEFITKILIFIAVIVLVAVLPWLGSFLQRIFG